MNRPRLDSRDLALVAVFAALIAALGLPGAFTLPATTVPITAQTLGVMLAGSILGARRGALAVAVFLALVAAGLPVLAGGRGGLSFFVDAGAGFRLSWVAGAFVVGALVSRRPARAPLLPSLLLANTVGGILVVYLIGIPWMAWVGDLPLRTAASLSAAFLPGDLVKVAIASVVTAGVLRGYPAIAERDHVGAGAA